MRTVYLDAQGETTADPAEAVRGEVVEYDSSGRPAKRTWFLVKEAEVSWLPVSESAFLLWVLVSLAAIWAVIGLALRFIWF
jgi:hypothetical protein